MRFLNPIYRRPLRLSLSLSLHLSPPPPPPPVAPTLSPFFLFSFSFCFSFSSSSSSSFLKVAPPLPPPAAMDSQETAPAANGFAGDGVCGVSGDGDLQKSRVTVVGSGNWGSVAAKLIASNTLKLPSFHDEVRMWVYEETLTSGEKLTDIINQTNENVKYLPGIKLGKNVIADPDLDNAVSNANMLVFVTPHQFMDGICKRLVGTIKEGAEAISLVKGMEVKVEGPRMISSLISEQLGINCSVLMGANIAKEIADEKFSEATVGYRGNKQIAEKWVQLFSTPHFMVTAVPDVEGVELCGTLKNVVAIAAGFVDGLEMGNNTKAAIMRIGLREMRVFSKLLSSSVKDSTFFESCGVADLITTCCKEAFNFFIPSFEAHLSLFCNSFNGTVGGRNRRVAEAFAKNGGERSFDELEAEMLQGQKLQGVSTAREVYEVLTHRGWLELFPLFATVHEICIGRLPPSAIVEYGEHKPYFSWVEHSAL